MRHDVLPFHFFGKPETDEGVADPHHFVDGTGQYRRQSDQPCAGSGKHHAADGAARMVHVVQVERIADADDQLRRGFADDFLGFFESLVAGHVLQADLVFDAFGVFE